MANIMNTKDQIIAYIRGRKQATAKEITNHLGFSRQIVHRHLNDLITEKRLAKIGRPPKVFYLLEQKLERGESPALDPQIQQTIKENFLLITPAGERQEGVAGFVAWCQKQKLPVEKTASEYVQTLEKYSAYKKGGLIDGMYKLQHTFSETFLDQVFYLDFYAIDCE